MKTWMPIFAIVITIIATIIWFEPGLGVFAAFAILPYLVMHLIVREDYIHSIQRCTSEYHISYQVRHLT
jgi:hypothetical protein